MAVCAKMRRKEPMITVIELARTCFACPSQWEGTTDRGKYIYIRYRWGYLEVELAENENAWRFGHYQSIYDMQVGDDLDGSMGNRVLIELLDGIVKFDCEIAERMLN